MRAMHFTGIVDGHAADHSAAMAWAIRRIVTAIGAPLQSQPNGTGEEQYVAASLRCDPHFAKAAVASFWWQMIVAKDNPATAWQTGNSSQQMLVIAGVCHQPELWQVSGLDCAHPLAYSGVDG